ncbi:MAG: branched-chain amino acid ABC transporter permease [Actinobacteria bacterium]|nr:branched-chain amino acid ABC transporter permease [Actinomycetota bacterium]
MLLNLGQLVINGLLIGGFYALISIGLTMIFGVTNLVNFAHGEFLMISMYATFWLHKLFGLDPYLAILVVAPLLFLAGVIIHKLIIERLLTAPHHMQVFATVGLSIVLVNLALFLWQADYRSVSTPYSDASWVAGGLRISVPKAFGFFVALAMAGGLLAFLKLTPMGRAIRATAQDQHAAKLMGIDIKRVYLWAFGIGTACVGVAGAILTPFYYVFPTVGQFFVTAAFVVVVLGGMGSMVGAFLGGLIIGLVESFSGFFIAPVWKEMVYFGVFVLILLLKPSGLFGLGQE